MVPIGVFGIRLSPGAFIALILCLLGIVLQFLPGKGAVVGQTNSVVTADAKRIPTSRASDVLVMRSDARRGISERKFHFDFEMLERGALAGRFLRKYPAMRSALDERRILAGRVEKFRNQGLGIKHPDVVAIGDRLTSLEAKIVTNWKAFRDVRRGRRPKE